MAEELSENGTNSEYGDRVKQEFLEIYKKIGEKVRLVSLTRTSMEGSIQQVVASCANGHIRVCLLVPRLCFGQCLFYLSSEYCTFPGLGNGRIITKLNPYLAFTFVPRGFWPFPKSLIFDSEETFSEFSDILKSEEVVVKMGEAVVMFKTLLVSNLCRGLSRMWTTQNISQNLEVLEILKDRFKDSNVPQW